jgi:hypothetical protein
MGGHVVRALLIFVALMAARDSLAFECRRRLLSEDEQRTLETYVLKMTGIAANPNSIRACRNWDVVELQTVRAPQPEGTERMSWLQCSRMSRRRPEPWHCVEHPQRGFRADTFPGELGVWIAMNGPMTLADARHDVAVGFELLGRDGEVPPCAWLKEKPRTFKSLREQINGGDGVVILSREPGQFSLYMGDVIVSFAHDARARARVECWSFEEIVVTS